MITSSSSASPSQPKMQVHGSCCLAWFNTDYAGLYEEPLSCADQDPSSYDDSYYLTYEEDRHPTIQDYTPKQVPNGYGGCDSWLREYFAGCDWGGWDDEAYSESDETFQSNRVCECDDDMHPNYNENDEWLGLGCGGVEDDVDDLEWDKWDGTTLYDRIFGY